MVPAQSLGRIFRRQQAIFTLWDHEISLADTDSAINTGARRKATADQSLRIKTGR